MNHLINQLMTVDKAVYRHYLEMLLTLNRIQALTPWQMSMLLWRAKIFHIQVLYPELLRISLCTEQEKDEIRFMKGWKLKELEKIMPAWQRRQCEEIKRERGGGFEWAAYSGTQCHAKSPCLRAVFVAVTSGRNIFNS